MIKVKIYGAGSIGNHLAQACRRKNWDVSVIDINTEALKRMKNEIYPKRYGNWDEEIKLYKLGEEPKGCFDVIFIGTPPDVRINLALEILKEEQPRILQLEKPFCSLRDFYHNRISEFLEALCFCPDVIVCVGYNHALAKSSQNVAFLLQEKAIGEIEFIETEFREHWEGIFAAHPWLRGPTDSYLGYTMRGGGALSEHSHAIHLWLYFAELANFGEVSEVSAFLDFDSTNNYDQVASLNLRTMKNKQGRIIQDVFSRPARKKAHLQGKDGFIEWYYGKDMDQVRFLTKYSKGEIVISIPKTRTDDFLMEIEHIESLLADKISVRNSPISLEFGIKVMKIINAAHQSNLRQSCVLLT